MLLIEAIIEKVEEYPYIFNRNHDLYKDNSQKTEAFQTIAMELSDDYDIALTG